MHYVLLALPYILQLTCIIHMFRTGRSGYWLYIIIFVPYVGGIAYLLMEIIPDLRLGRRIPQISDIVVSAVRPSHKIEKLKRDAAFTPSFNNRKNLADEYLNSGYFDEAIILYNELLQGHESNNTACLLQKAKALYGAGRYGEAGNVINTLDSMGYSYSRESEALVKLKIQEHTLDKTQIDALYEAVKQKFNSFEIMYYYIDYQIRQGEHEKALGVVREVRETREYLQKKRIAFDKTWANKAIARGRQLN